MKTDSLRKLIKSQLDSTKSLGVNEVYYKTAADNAGFPHVVFNLESIGTLTTDRHRNDYRLEVDVFDRNKSESLTFDICDTVEDLFRSANLPQDDILPTFFFSSRTSVLDEDKDIKHQLIRFDVQMYEQEINA